MMWRVRAAYSDAGLLTPNPNREGFMYSWVHVGHGDEELESETGLVLPPYHGVEFFENNLAETYAAIHCLSRLPEGWEGPFHCDNKHALGRLFTSELGYAAYAWNGVPEELRNWWLAGVRPKLGRVEPVLLGGHPSRADLACGRRKRDGAPVSKWNKLCDDRCNAEKARYFHLLRQGE